MGEDFHVHLISNVAPHTFPKNNPADFSTPLANEIALDGNGNEWEVAVRQIMYPTHVATTSTNDKLFIHKFEENFRGLLPFPPKNLHSLVDSGAKIIFKPKGHVKPKTEGEETSSKELVDYMLNTVNNSKWKNILRLEFETSQKKFVLNVLPKNIAIVMSKVLQKSLGFSERCFTKGTHWAWSPFNANKITIENMDTELFMIDLEALQHERHHLLSSFDVAHNYHIYEAQMPRLFQDSMPDSFSTEPRIIFSVHPKEGVIKIKPMSPLSKEMKSYEKRLMFFRFDDYSTEKLKLNDIYLSEENRSIKITSTLNTKDVESMYVDFYYYSIRNDLTVEVQKTPLASIDITTGKEIVKPQDLLPTLNAKSTSYGYAFSYDKLYKRYEVVLRNDRYALALTENLATILGFDPSIKYYYGKQYCRADDFPMLSRGITALYVYTNIIDSVHIGDVKAPLLLTCPFKQGNDHNDKVHQLEFLNPTYVPLNRSIINQINIAIYDDAGVPVPFLYGKTKLSLHFRKRK